MTAGLIALIGNEGVGGNGFTVTAAPVLAFSIGRTSPLVSATPANGTPAYTYSWTTDNPTVFADTPSASTTTFSTNSSDQDVRAMCKCTVQDANGLVASSNEIAALLAQGS